MKDVTEREAQQLTLMERFGPSALKGTVKLVAFVAVAAWATSKAVAQIEHEVQTVRAKLESRSQEVDRRFAEGDLDRERMERRVLEEIRSMRADLTWRIDNLTDRGSRRAARPSVGDRFPPAPPTDVASAPYAFDHPTPAP